jgi:hypothetical protein
VVKKNRKLVLERKMRNALFALMAVCAIAGTSSGPADATEFPYCLQGRGVGIPGDCQFRSYRECMVTASGRNLYCNINPRYAYGRQQRQHRYDYR